MGWDTILNLAGFLFGSGALVTLFMSGRRIGQLEEQLAAVQKRPEGLSRAEVEVMCNDVRAELVGALHALENSLGEDTEERVQIVHKRVDAFNELVGTTKHEAGQAVEAIRGMRREWDQLSSELRQLLRSESASSAEMAIMKDRFYAAEQRVAELMGRLSVLDTILRELPRNQTRK